ncbi:FAD-binding oxidoreductase [Microbacterium sp. SORGH_AS_0888]|uniref:FAD-binding oxidoreductase n=1 Tax=Microbacterium sp. SORGH_AS_0888 TaxID=3041791 RepID=UPI002785D7F1|nr:FAD-binding oxidoreductase [Microbacterium sp. SORGH_AS_0888]MDQ1131267.1 FAD/FMN-containing dehydrogenase [Microbacterium sp. SORGH_AS_0888]
METTDTSHRLVSLIDELSARLDPRLISVDRRQRERASLDGATMSPILSELLPAGLADVVITPRAIDDVPVIVSAAVRHDIPLTVRGRGTGNYGQGIPLHGGIVLDTSGLTAVSTAQDGSITAEAGARMRAIDLVARESGQELCLMPSTVQSSLGGFLAGGSGGAGTIEFGNTRQGFVLALDVVHAHADARIVHVTGEQAQAYLHSFGVAGVIVRATVRLRPALEWRPVFASFPTLGEASSVFRALGALTPAPKLVSADDPELVGTLPADDALAPDRVSLRTIVADDTLEAAVEIIEAAGGRVDEVRSGYAETMRMSVIAYNHPAWWFLRAHTGDYFHLEVFGDVLLDDPESVRSLFDEAHLHLELGHSVNFGMLLLPYRDPGDVTAAIERLAAVGIGAHDCHSWILESPSLALRSAADRNDPHGVLNPGKLIAAATA